MKLTVVMPTYNRSDLLGRALSGLLNQTAPAEDYEIVVVAEVVAPEPRLRYYRQENKGPAAARNYGTREAKGEIILFVGDDCIPDSRLLEEHLKAHSAGRPPAE